MPDRTLITGALVFDGTSDELQRVDILVEGDEIRAVGANLGATVDATAERIDAAGQWITPGFIDMHVHATVLGMEALPMMVGLGITTVRDVGGDTARAKQMKLDVECGKVVGPNIIYSGPLLQEAGATSSGAPRRGTGAGAVPFTSEADAIDAVRRLIEEEGVQSLKIYRSVREPIAAAILKTAEGRVPVTGHLGLTSSAFAFQHGIGGVEHITVSIIRDIAPPNRRLAADDHAEVPGHNQRVVSAWADMDINGAEVQQWLKIFLDSKGFIDATISLGAARPKPDDPRLTLVPASFCASIVGAMRVAAGAQAPRSEYTDADETARARESQRAIFRLIHQSGGDLVVGTDMLPGALPGYGYHAELTTFQNRGMKPFEVLRAATSKAAKHLWRTDLGVVAPGAKADLVFFDQDPTADIAAIASISRVMRGGVVHESSKMLAIAEPDSSRFFPPDPTWLPNARL